MEKVFFLSAYSDEIEEVVLSEDQHSNVWDSVTIAFPEGSSRGGLLTTGYTFNSEAEALYALYTRIIARSRFLSDESKKARKQANEILQLITKCGICKLPVKRGENPVQTKTGIESTCKICMEKLNE